MITKNNCDNNTSDENNEHDDSDGSNNVIIVVILLLNNENLHCSYLIALELGQENNNRFYNRNIDANFLLMFVYCAQ